MRWALVFMIGALILGCSPEIEKEKSKGNPEKIISRDEAVGSLPCFKCHSYQQFSAAPRKGIFSHLLHRNSGYHCNQCHDFKGHEYLTINGEPCGNCHDMKIITLNSTGLPSRFNHEFHSKIFNCKDCHPKIFLMNVGAANITMKGIECGLYCGACHNGQKAFSSSECKKCHTIKGL